MCVKHNNDGVPRWPSRNRSESDNSDDVVSEMVRKHVSRRLRRSSHRSSEGKCHDVRAKNARRRSANKKGVPMRSIGSQAGEDSPTSDSDGERRVERKDFSCQVTWRDLEIFARDIGTPDVSVKSIGKVCRLPDKTRNVEPAKK